MAFLDKWNLAPVRVRYSDWSQAELDQLQALVAEGLTDLQLSMRIGRTIRAVRRQRVMVLGIRRNNMIGPASDWTPERTETLKALAAEGWSNGQIALKMGLTRNAVIGKRNRLKLPSRGPGINFDKMCLPHKPRKDGRASTYLRPARSKAKVIPIAVVEPLRVGFMDLGRNHCRWVLDEVGDDGLALYCGHPKLGPHSYCPGHWRITTDRSKDRRFKWASPPLMKVFI